MAFSLNKVQLIGNIGKDPETRFTSNNIPVTSFSVATQHSYKDKSEQWVNQTDWANIVCWNLSDYLKNNLHKGSKVYIEGRLTSRSYEAKDGTTKYVTEVIGDSNKLILLDAKQDTNQTSSQSYYSLPEDGNEDLPF